MRAPMRRRMPSMKKQRRPRALRYDLFFLRYYGLIGLQDGASLVKRACKKDKCNCIGLKKGAIFCGDGVFGCKKGNVYQCNSNGKTTCNFGVRGTCKKCNKLKC
ncbi:hypothetical protein BKA62DRAFT_216236 [Auriculariales sp. MPI-PUGE-AT-0066]|nr:hypothetical protein BKA62DRAFT_216236 [Auriculariales sp. MPI-PUGE-AT-0066]